MVLVLVFLSEKEMVQVCSPFISLPECMHVTMPSYRRVWETSLYSVYLDVQSKPGARLL